MDLNLKIQTFNGCCHTPGTIYIRAVGKGIGSRLAEFKNGCIAIFTNDVNTFSLACQVAKILDYSGKLKPQIQCGKLTHNVPVLDCEKYKMLFFHLLKNLTPEKLASLNECLDDIESRIRENESEIEGLRHLLFVFSYEAVL
ncbi:MAG: hypothetical protein MJ198_05520 [Bacteroidales bacterium]|nr:hypothetical protein [Bacteroidales bacterium]